MKTKLKCLLIMTVISVMLVGCGTGKKELQRFDIQFFEAFDTITNFQVFGYDEAEANAQIEQLRNEYFRLHEIFDRYHSYGDLKNLYYLNHHPGEAVPVAPELYDLIDTTLQRNREISAKVNIAMGPAIDLWTAYRDVHLAGGEAAAVAKFGKPLPSRDELEALRPLMDQTHIVLDPEAKTVTIEPGMILDLGAVAKGYAAELVGEMARELGVKSMLISAGGNVKLVGEHPTKPAYKVAIQNPLDGNDQSNYLRVIEANDVAIVTSGDYQRFFDYNGRRYHHILDPETLEPKTLYKSFSIVTKDSGEADFLSTALFLSTMDEARAIAEARGLGIIYYTEGGELGEMGLEHYEK
ncbi:FAD:protein FMN transferase [Peptoniphilus equinus]|uniref:FAD:protein FMN transferase n=1 Tax=Peptoniphilus equinus TaxID=3016343 RepID=A0ABY7QUI0_9FIRM|nr:FAD:protein FMN transferase [Peptoniphilus equinus]WBW50435.1 FAD:protein FMN transferase [Peptoniphilus equinus]